MCLERFSVTGLEAMNIEPWLSPWMGTGLLNLKPSSPIRARSHVTWRLQSESAMYSASVDDSATVFCAFEVQLVRPPAILTKYPVWERRVSESDAQSESVQALRPSPVAPS